MSTETYRWRFDSTLPSGHMLFTEMDMSPSAIAICDDSGDYPDETDDGVLWLDFSRSLMMDEDISYVPVTDNDGNEHKVGVGTATIVLLASRYNWEVNVRGVLFTIKRKGNNGAK